MLYNNSSSKYCMYIVVVRVRAIKYEPIIIAVVVRAVVCC